MSCNYLFSLIKRYDNDISGIIPRLIPDISGHEVKSAKLTNVKLDL